MARRRLDEDGRAVLMTYTHGTAIAIDEDDLHLALAAAAALHWAMTRRSSPTTRPWRQYWP